MIREVSRWMDGGRVATPTLQPHRNLETFYLPTPKMNDWAGPRGPYGGNGAISQKARTTISALSDLVN